MKNVIYTNNVVPHSLLSSHLLRIYRVSAARQRLSVVCWTTRSFSCMLFLSPFCSPILEPNLKKKQKNDSNYCCFYNYLLRWYCYISLGPISIVHNVVVVIELNPGHSNPNKFAWCVSVAYIDGFLWRVTDAVDNLSGLIPTRPMTITLFFALFNF